MTDSSYSNVTANVPIDATAVEMPFLHHESIDLLSNCCTSKEFDLWQSLGPNWTQVVGFAFVPILASNHSEDYF
jgi:hypothetical protein